MTRAAPLALLVLLMLAGADGCAPREVRPPPGTLVVNTDDPASLVWIDDTLIGRAQDLIAQPIALRPGFHRVEVHAEGKLTAYRGVDLRSGERAVVSLRLRPDLDASDAP